MDIKLVSHGEEGELVMTGRLDTNTAPDAEVIFDQVSERFNTIVLNMKELDYISSAGLRSLKRLHMTMRKKNGELFLSNVNKSIMEVFEMTGFAGLLQFR